MASELDRTGTDLTNSTVLDAPLGGLIENGVHNGVHSWTGDPNLPLIQDMGTFTTAARDPIFYAHHSNVDRLWDKWKYDMPGGPRADHDDSDFLHAEFYFYDETASLVKVKVRDALDNSKLGVSYPTMAADKLWIHYKSPVTSKGSAIIAARAAGVATMGAAPQNGTIFLGSNFSAIVKTPSSPPPATSKATVLVIQAPSTWEPSTSSPPPTPSTATSLLMSSLILVTTCNELAFNMSLR
ncbi:hypothetical protein GOP47_0024480 [Adiantum capillus-veneris]|uniref:Tyrosinase copper-binding domain-containing protein n=1 Tax=Adiantum capillus-veneris TaxID=13818 RepID=A0A9D4U329_ADICA|nr:hypothetical protein GOP47_0024480 [Adiantum capillus-veneris]